MTDYSGERTSQFTNDDSNEWSRWHSRLDRANSELETRKRRQNDGDELWMGFQNDITHNERVMLAIEHDYPILRQASTDHIRARVNDSDAQTQLATYETRCKRARNIAGIVGALAITLCFTMTTTPILVVILAVAAPLAAIAAGLLPEFGAEALKQQARDRGTELRFRAAELDRLREQVGRGEREPNQRSGSQPGSRGEPGGWLPEPNAGSLVPAEQG